MIVRSAERALGFLELSLGEAAAAHAVLEPLITRSGLGHPTAEAAAEWAQRAIDVARRTRRAKYEARSLSTLGQALARLKRPDDALAALRSAVDIADRIVSPYARWNARAALGRVAYDVGRDDEAAAVYGEAREIVEAFRANLAPERAATLATSPVVQEIRSA